MVANLPTILYRLGSSDDETAQEAAKWLAQTNITVLSRVARTTVYEAAHLWEVRLQNSLSRKNRLYGAEALLKKLKAMTPQKQLEQVGFSGSGMTGNIYFESASGNFVGALMVKHANKSLSELENLDPKTLVRSGGR